MTTDDISCGISGIQHFSPYPGYGIRTTVFFMGCPLRCRWCCNPESRLSHPVLVCNTDKCIGLGICRHCLDACPRAAVYTDRNHVGVARDRCDNCGRCVSQCPSQALFMSGKRMVPAEIMEDVLKDKDFVKNGGLTLGGGEPMMHPRAAAALLRLAHDQGLHTALETCGFFDADDPHAVAALQETDLLFFDLKHSDPVTHRAHTGVDNSRILANFARLGREFPHLEIISRTLVVPGFNDDDATMRDIARLVVKTGSRFHALTLYSALCRDKYAQLGLPYDYSPLVPGADRIRTLIGIFQQEGISVEIHP